MGSLLGLRPYRRALSLSVLTLVAALFALPIGAAAPVTAVSHSAPAAAPGCAGGPNATWNGVNLSHASSVGSAFSVTTGQQSVVRFCYSTVAPQGPSITTARLVVYYFGSEISANSVPASDGRAVMNWTLGTYTYLLQGVYRLTASLVAANGSTVWSEGFYIVAQAPYRIVSGMTVFLLVLGGVEIWSIVTSGGRSSRKKRVAPPTPWTPTPAPSETPPPATPPPGSSPPAGGGP